MQENPRFAPVLACAKQDKQTYETKDPALEMLPPGERHRMIPRRSAETSGS